MPGVNYTGGRRNAAKVRLRDVDARQQKTHFSHQRRSLVFNKFQEASVRHGDGAHSIDLAHARERFPNSTLGVANSSSSRNYIIPQPQRIRPLATTISPRKSPPKLSTDDVNDPFEMLRRKLMASSDLVGLNTNDRPRVEKETRGQAYTGANRRRPGDQAKREETVTDRSSSSSAPTSPSFRPAHSLLDSAPSRFAVKLPTALSFTAPEDPWTVLSTLTDIDYLPDVWDLYTPRDTTYPAHDPLDIPERAGLDFRLSHDVTVDTVMLRSSDASSSTLCDDKVPQTAAYDPRSDSIPAQDADESTSATAAAPEDDIFDWLMEEDSDAESIKVEADQDFVQLPTSSLDSAYDPEQLTHEMELPGSPPVSASVSRPLSSLTCAEPFPDETTEQPFFLDPFESPVSHRPSSSLTPSPPPPQPARSYPRQMTSYSPVLVQPEATVPALDALVSMFSDCPDPPHRYESSSVVKIVRQDPSPRLLDIEGVPTFDLVGPGDARSSPLIPHTALVHDGVNQVDGVLEDQTDATDIDLVPQFSAFWEDEE